MSFPLGEQHPITVLIEGQSAQELPPINQMKQIIEAIIQVDIPKDFGEKMQGLPPQSAARALDGSLQRIETFVRAKTLQQRGQVVGNLNAGLAGEVYRVGTVAKQVISGKPGPFEDDLSPEQRNILRRQVRAAAPRARSILSGKDVGDSTGDIGNDAVLVAALCREKVRQSRR